ncbi:MFS transporter [Sphingobium amiense]|uniref:MFS transporter n=2 Tax=Sphingobium amiense TaxID=135719 RepID=UPI00083575AA|nr:MFS transporter [Sphingobium amiense]
MSSAPAIEPLAREMGQGPRSVIDAALDDHAPTTAHRRLFWLICAALFVDFFDLTMGGVIAASLLREGWTTLSLNSMFFSAAGLGAAAGVFAAGILADQIGRVRVLQLCLGLMTVGTLLCAGAPTMEFLIAARVLAAIGMGGVPTISYVYLSEVLPARVRGAWISGAGVAVAMSSTAASVTGYYMLPLGGWRPMFLLPVVAGLLLIVMLGMAPESPRWLAVRGRWQRATQELARIAAAAPTLIAASRTVANPVPAAATGPTAGPGALFRAPLLKRLLLAMGLAIAATVTSNSAVAWMPTVLMESASVERGLGDNFVIMLGAPLGSVVGYFILSRVSRRGALAVTSILGAGIAASCAFIGRDAGLIPLALVLMALINLVCTIILGVYLPELFPTALRARGSAFALTASRLSLIAAPFAMAAVLAAYGRPGVMLSLMACFLVVTLLVTALGVETASGPLQD